MPPSMRHRIPTTTVAVLLLASFAMRAHVCYVYVRGEFIRERQALQRAVLEHRADYGSEWEVSSVVQFSAKVGFENSLVGGPFISFCRG